MVIPWTFTSTVASIASKTVLEVLDLHYWRVVAAHKFLVKGNSCCHLQKDGWTSQPIDWASLPGHTWTPCRPCQWWCAFAHLWRCPSFCADRLRSGHLSHSISAASSKIHAFYDGVNSCLTGFPGWPPLRTARGRLMLGQQKPSWWEVFVYRLHWSPRSWRTSVWDQVPPRYFPVIEEHFLLRPPAAALFKEGWLHDEWKIWPPCECHNLI